MIRACAGTDRGFLGKNFSWFCPQHSVAVWVILLIIITEQKAPWCHGQLHSYKHVSNKFFQLHQNLDVHHAHDGGLYICSFFELQWLQPALVNLYRKYPIKANAYLECRCICGGRTWGKIERESLSRSTRCTLFTSLEFHRFPLCWWQTRWLWALGKAKTIKIYPPHSLRA